MKLLQTLLCNDKLFKYSLLRLQSRLLYTGIMKLDNYKSKDVFNMRHEETKYRYDIIDYSWNSKLLEPHFYICQIPDEKRIQKFIPIFNYWLKIPNDKLLAIKNIVEELHSAFTLFDDIQDSSNKRRGIPVAHSIYGIPRTINSAILLIFSALENVLHLNHTDVFTVCIEILNKICAGQGMKLYWRDNYICPTEDDYRNIVVLKMGQITMIMHLMEIFSENKRDFGHLITIMNTYLQIRNDYQNMFVKNVDNKGCYFEDLTDGKFSFPIIHAIQSHPDDKTIINILRQRTNDPEIKKYCVSLLDHFGSIDYTRKVLMDMDLQARREISKLGGNPLLETFLDEMLDWKIIK